MTQQYFKKSPILKIVNSTLVSLPAPINLSSMWNFGSLLGMCLMAQILSGLLLASSYAPDMATSFATISKSMESSDAGWLVRSIHSNGASLFFICLYLHVGRGLYSSSFIMTHTWNLGATLFLLTMATAFLGYVLPTNQMSFWGASVITNLFSEVPYIGPQLVQFVWGGPSIDSPTITRFYTFHFILPFIILALAALHITLLHSDGSSNPMGLLSLSYKIQFHPYFSMKDMVGVVLSLTLFLAMCLWLPILLGDNENFLKSNPSVTPHHIQPEWYFLFAYAILRSIPNKMGGVVALALSVLILYLLPLLWKPEKSAMFYPINKTMFWLLVSTVILLTWIGAQPVEPPFIATGQLLTLMYFSLFMLTPPLTKLTDSC